MSLPDVNRHSVLIEPIFSIINQWRLQTFPQNHFAGILSSNFPQETLYGLKFLQKDLGSWIDYYNNERIHQGKICNGERDLEQQKLEPNLI